MFIINSKLTQVLAIISSSCVICAHTVIHFIFTDDNVNVTESVVHGHVVTEDRKSDADQRPSLLRDIRTSVNSDTTYEGTPSADGLLPETEDETYGKEISCFIQNNYVH